MKRGVGRDGVFPGVHEQKGRHGYSLQPRAVPMTAAGATRGASGLAGEGALSSRPRAVRTSQVGARTQRAGLAGQQRAGGMLAGPPERSSTGQGTPPLFGEQADERRTNGWGQFAGTEPPRQPHRAAGKYAPPAGQAEDYTQYWALFSAPEIEQLYIVGSFNSWLPIPLIKGTAIPTPASAARARAAGAPLAAAISYGATGTTGQAARGSATPASLLLKGHGGGGA